MSRNKSNSDDNSENSKKSSISYDLSEDEYLFNPEGEEAINSERRALLSNYTGLFGKYDLDDNEQLDKAWDKYLDVQERPQEFSLGSNSEDEVEELTASLQQVVLDNEHKDNPEEIENIAAFVYNDESIAFVNNPNAYYDNIGLNYVIINATYQNDDIALIPITGNDISARLANFRDSNQNTLLIPLHLPSNRSVQILPEHFVCLYVTRKQNQEYQVVYVDPASGSFIDTGLPNEVRQALINILQINEDEIVTTSNIIQHYQGNTINNVHCGAFTGFILENLALGKIRIDGERLQINTGIEEENWQDIDLNASESDRLGISIRAMHGQILSEQEVVEDPFQTLINIIQNRNIAQHLEQQEVRYTLKRSDSNMTQYTDLIEEIMQDHNIKDVDDDLKKKKQHDVVDVIVQNPDRQKIDEKIKDFKSKNLSLGQQLRNKQITEKQKSKKQASNTKEYTKLKKDKEKLPKDTEIDYEQKEIETRIMHLFRGKNLNSKLTDPKTKDQRPRTKKEKEDYVTKKYKGETLYSDGTDLVKDDAENLELAETETRKYFKNIKDNKLGEGVTKLFNAGTSYEKAVKELMDKTKLTGNTVVATSKFPWVASEYMAGQMGGNAGGDRAVSFGYQKDGKPVNRLMGNGFVMSLRLEDYRSLRESNDLIDVNVDIARGIDPNRMIEEVTFVSKVEGKYVLGSLPFILPRLDRDWDKGMDREKHAQYRRVFGLDKKKYKKFQGYLKEGEYPIGKMTEHLIQHHGNLLREIAIKIDREQGYEGNFVTPRNPQYCGPLDDVNKEGNSLKKRDARTGSSEKKSKYLKPDIKKEEGIKPKKLDEELKLHANEEATDVDDLTKDFAGDKIDISKDKEEPSTQPNNPKSSTKKENDKGR